MTRRTEPTPFGAPQHYYSRGPVPPKPVPDRDGMRPAAEVETSRRLTALIQRERNGIHAQLRKLLRLGGGGSDSAMKVDIYVSDILPPNVADVLGAMGDDIRSMLDLRRRLPVAARTLDHARIHLRDEHVLEAVSLAPALRELAAKLDRDVDAFLERYFAVPGDSLGAYWLGRRTITLHQKVIEPLATALDVPMEDLALVTLIHEMAHFYTHEGRDADGASWATRAMADADLHIVEGLAQYYTLHICEGLDSRSGRKGPIEAFHRLLQWQSSEYQCFQEWPRKHAREFEVVRRALVRCRAVPLTGYPDFLNALHDGADALAAHGPLH